MRAIIAGMLLILGLSGLRAGAQQGNLYLGNPEVNRLFYTGFRHLYDFEFHSCEEKTRQLKQRFPASPWGYVLEAEYHWWMIISGDKGTGHGAGIGTALEVALEKAGQLGEKEQVFCKIICYSLSSRYALYQGKYVKVLEQLNHAAGLLRSGRRDIEQYEPFKLTQGLFDYFMAEAGSRFGIFNPLSLFGINADKERGLNYLRQCSQSKDEILRTESRYFLMKIYAELEHQAGTSCQYGIMLAKAYPDNLVFRWHARTCPESAELAVPMHYSAQLNETQRLHFIRLFQSNPK